MKRTTLFVFLLLTAMPLFADNNCTAISLNHKGGPRGGIPLYADKASGTVTLEDGFKVEKGATFAVYPSSF